VYCCHACNEFKGDFWQPDSPLRILHPLREEPASHWTEQDDGTLLPQSESGAFHIERLHLNRGPLAAYRQERRRLDLARQTQARLLERLQRLEEQVQTLIARLERHEGGEPNA
jgi:hypothetical protein